MSKKLKVAAVGCGGIGMRHQLGYLEHPQAELVAVCDIDAEKAKNRAQELGIRQLVSVNSGDGGERRV